MFDAVGQRLQRRRHECVRGLDREVRVGGRSQIDDGVSTQAGEVLLDSSQHDPEGHRRGLHHGMLVSVGDDVERGLRHAGRSSRSFVPCGGEEGCEHGIVQERIRLDAFRFDRRLSSLVLEQELRREFRLVRAICPGPQDSNARDETGSEESEPDGVDDAVTDGDPACVHSGESGIEACTDRTCPDRARCRDGHGAERDEAQ
ncbi:hypothetical protein [Curtobacterium sp. SL109]|uniref:hypothetical protein n=1 Tax=Curtobacterium sp. SL109 TaxID=2994662 RepID=UPI0022754912|nr:hypothetical protein [Curtobacterium sp. SL109]MCY1693027.1 hypothetical protein [Curtobacterium sp. SL109]